MSCLIKLITFITAFGNVSAILSQPISRETAVSLVKNEIIGIDTNNFNVYMLPEIYTNSFCITRMGDTIENPYSFSRLFFVDEMPAYNWGHACSYIFIDTTNGNFQRIENNFFSFGYKENMDGVSISYIETIMQILPPETPVLYNNTSPLVHDKN
jgi:hypothetical protein